MIESTARVITPNAMRYLTQLCKHFEHRVPATYADGSGKISFPAGDCSLTAQEGVLVLHVAAPDEAGLAQQRDVVERHLVRFAFREDLAVAWG
jgi:hypothetical protein